VRTNEGEEAQRFWWMYFDLLQLSGERDAFEQLGQRFTGQYAISPPIWPTTQQAASGLDAPILPTDAYYLNGDIRNCKFEELKPVFAKHRLPILDFAAVRRMDFFSAGQLANRLSIFKHGGREIVIRSPNHLLAELMGVVGINKTARILIPKL
jgi:anti-anti-sigma regulatory factor